jgi:hypothetical protein
MTTTPASGTYLVFFSASGYGTDSAQQMMYAIHLAGTIEQHSEREMDFASGGQGDDLHETMHTQAKVTVNGSQAITVQYKTGTGTFYVEERSMILIKVG